MLGAGHPVLPADGGDVALAIEIELADVLTGLSREVDFEVVETCEHCRGNGAEPGTPIEACETCGGQGQVRQVSFDVAWDVYKGRRPGTVLAVCVDEQLRG